MNSLIWILILVIIPFAVHADVRGEEAAAELNNANRNLIDANIRLANAKQKFGQLQQMTGSSQSFAGVSSTLITSNDDYQNNYGEPSCIAGKSEAARAAAFNAKAAAKADCLKYGLTRCQFLNPVFSVVPWIGNPNLSACGATVSATGVYEGPLISSVATYSAKSEGWPEDKNEGYGDKTCLSGVSVRAKSAASNAINGARMVCQQSGLKNCSNGEFAVVFSTAFYDHPICIATASIKGFRK